ncbi:MAG: hypothetical protein LBR49_08160 [Tannerella sp.]|nr:hypothetical protein [Tannerella sp.]
MRPARLPIPPSGRFVILRGKDSDFFEYDGVVKRKFALFLGIISFMPVNQDRMMPVFRCDFSCAGAQMRK